MNRTLEMGMNVLTRFGAKATNLLVFLIVSRNLSVEDVGIYGLAFSLMLILSTSWDIGTRNSVAYFIGQNPTEASKYTIASLALFPFCAIGSAASVYLSISYHAVGSTDISLLFPAVASVVPMLFLRMFQGILMGQGRLVFFNQTELMSRVVLLCLTLAFLAFDAVNLLSALWAIAISQWAAALLLACGIWSSTPRASFDKDALRRMIARGFPFMLGTLLMLSSKRLSFLMLSAMGQPTEVGLFFALQRTSEIMTEIGLAVAVVTFSHNVRSKTTEEAVEITAHSVRISFSLFMVMSIFAFVLADYLVPLLLSNNYAGHGNLFRIILIGTLIGTIWTILQPALSAFTSPMVAFYIFLVSFLVSMMAMLPAYEFGGTEGAAWCFVFTNLLMSGAFIGYFKWKWGTPISSFIFLKREDLKDLAKVWQKLRKKLHLR